MKQICTLLLLVHFSFLEATNKNTTLMTIEDQPISIGEFEYLYNKNKQVSTDENSLEDYIDLFINFKLKVQEAKSLGYDTASSFVNELNIYRNQLSEPYLKDLDLDQKLILEAYERLKEEVEASHILIKLDANSTDTLKAYNQALKARDEIISGESFKNVAQKYSEDPSVKINNGYLGYFSGFQMVLPFEEAAFKTPVGEISQPVRSNFGYHLIYVSNRRPAKGNISVAHILIASNNQMSQEEQSRRKEQAFELYNRILNGEEFGEIAERYSQDHASAENNGKLGLISTGQTVPAFENAAFAIKNIGDISEPVLTNFGWHIIRLENRKKLPSFEDKKEEIKRRLARDERGTRPQKVFIERLKKEYNYSINEANLQTLYTLAKNKSTNCDFQKDLALMDETIMTFGNTYKTQQDLIKYTQSINPNGTNFESQFENFEEQCILDYEKSQLEYKYEDFKYLVNEYYHGLLLFKISNENIWNKAAKDEEGLNMFYKKNKKKYTFRDSYFGGDIIYLKDSSTLIQYNTLSTSLSLNEITDSINTKGNLMKTESGYYKVGDNEAVDKYKFGSNITNIDEKYSVILLKGKHYEIGDIKPLNATRGTCISDYQNYLEEKWIKQLRKKYKVKIDKKVLEQLQQ